MTDWELADKRMTREFNAEGLGWEEIISADDPDNPERVAVWWTDEDDYAAAHSTDDDLWWVMQTGDSIEIRDVVGVPTEDFRQVVTRILNDWDSISGARIWASRLRVAVPIGQLDLPDDVVGDVVSAGKTSDFEFVITLD